LSSAKSADPFPPSLEELEKRFFGSTPAQARVSRVTYLIDGSHYLGAIADEIEQTVAGDRIYILGWYFNPKIDLRGRSAADPGFIEVGDLLAQKAAAGVDVRVVLNGAQFLGALGAPGYSTCYDAMVDLRARLASGAAAPPLVSRVLYDWSGAEFSGSQHQKAFLITHAGTTTAFVGGIDINPLMIDRTPHNSQVLPGTTPPVWWGWHDGGVRLVGGAAAAVLANFADRWLEAITLPPATLWVRNPSGFLPRLVSYEPPPISIIPPAPQVPSPNPSPQSSVQVLRSRSATKLNRPWKHLSWTTAGGGELTEVHETLSKAIQAAQRYVYIEDQFLADHPTLPKLVHRGAWRLADILIGGRRLDCYSLFPYLEAALVRNVKVILVGSGYADPDDLIPGPKNLVLNEELKKLARINPADLAVWRIEQLTEQKKQAQIDDT
jgi:phosphatidylserine/phosphatidylglycerophosphate/cardiolipin synthase-like enzyme